MAEPGRPRPVPDGGGRVSPPGVTTSPNRCVLGVATGSFGKSEVLIPNGASADRLGLRQIPSFAAVVTPFLLDGGENVRGT